jgi:hypothetical protein
MFRINEIISYFCDKFNNPFYNEDQFYYLIKYPCHGGLCVN